MSHFSRGAQAIHRWQVNAGLQGPLAPLGALVFTQCPVDYIGCRISSSSPPCALPPFGEMRCKTVALLGERMWACVEDSIGKPFHNRPRLSECRVTECGRPRGCACAACTLPFEFARPERAWWALVFPCGVGWAERLEGFLAKSSGLGMLRSSCQAWVAPDKHGFEPLSCPCGAGLTCCHKCSSARC